MLPLYFVIKEHFYSLAKAKEYICQSLDTSLQVYAPDMNSVTSQWEKFLLVPIVKRLAAYPCLYPTMSLLSSLSFSSASTHLRQILHPATNLLLTWVKSLGTRSSAAVQSTVSCYVVMFNPVSSL